MTKINDEIVKEAKRLHELGCAVHWCYPREKRPVGAKWTTGARKSWADLMSAYEPGYNVGVRTGGASNIGEDFLFCFDLDIKDPACRDEAVSALINALGGAVCPEVRSGSGNGSRHLYALSRKPFKMVTVAKHPGWELCAYSEGRQMVLPPSIHPSGCAYEWKRPLRRTEDLPLLEVPIGEQAVEKKTPVSCAKNIAAMGADFSFVVDEGLDLRWMLPEIPEAIRKLITIGLWKGLIITDDRSAFLKTACEGLVKCGVARDTILTIMTDPDLFMGRVALDRRADRQSAGAWVWEYALKEMTEKHNPKTIFAGPIVELELSADGAKEQEGELREDGGFYTQGGKGALNADFDALLAAFDAERPHRTIADMKNVFVFNGTHYVDLTPYEMKAFCETKMVPRPSEKIRAEFVSKILATNVQRRDFFTDTVAGKINFKNGVLDLNGDDGALLPHTPEYGFRGVLPYDFDPEAKCPVFQKWLNGVMLGDKELVAVVQEYMGYIVRGGEYKYHKALWLGGVGRNGKSTFIDVLKALIGAGNYSVISIKALINDKFVGAELDGKIANFSEETSPEELKDSGPFKNLTGDGEILAQKKFGDPYHFRNKGKLVMTYNQIPDLSDLSPGMLSRPLIVPFEKIIEEHEQDQGIKKKLFKELNGVFNFALEGWHRLEEQGGFTKSERSELALTKIKEESCNVFQWVENHVERVGADEGGKHYRPQELHAIYSRQEKYPFNFIKFCRRLNAHPTMKKQWNRYAKGVVYEWLKVV